MLLENSKYKKILHSKYKPSIKNDFKTFTEVLKHSYKLIYYV